ncbi:MFS transporter [Streptomyces xiaopingdaonensis]|uniref:MFS transporter n=1 Tax=Streptomyces xiaopingdaonensis TaxID=1565415 RepID=UPI0003119BDF|nr:MFS transporter [Streptomyces xiaopingdaonensis]
MFFLSRTASRFGDGMVPVALSLGLVATGHGASAVSFALGAWTACFGGLVLFSGVLADRYSARTLMIAADAGRAVVTVGLAVLFTTDTPPLALVYLLSAVNGVGAALFQPGIASTIPSLTTAVRQANAVIRVTESLMMTAGPAVAGVIAGFGSASALFLVDAVTFALSGLFLVMMRRRKAAGPRGTSLLRDLAEGWREFRSRTWLWAVIAVWTVYSLASLGAQLPLQAVLITESHGADVFGLMMAVQGAGNVAGGLVAFRASPRRPLAAGTLALFGVAVGTFALAASAPAPLIAAALFAGGAGLAFWVVMWSTSMQTHVPRAALNRVNAYDVAGSVLSLAAGRALAGPVAQHLGAHWLLAVSTGVNLVVIVVLLAIPAVRNLPRAVGTPPGSDC